MLPGRILTPTFHIRLLALWKLLMKVKPAWKELEAPIPLPLLLPEVSWRSVLGTSERRGSPVMDRHPLVLVEYHRPSPYLNALYIAS